MNILPQIEARKYSSAADIIAETMRRRARFDLAGRKPDTKKPGAETGVPTEKFLARQAPLWDYEAIHFDQHVLDFRRHLWQLAERTSSPTRAYVKDRCKELGVSYADIIGPDRRRCISNLRHLLMWEVKTKFGLSFPAIGRLFGGRDHTTALYSVSKIEAEKDGAAKAQAFVARKILMREKAYYYRQLAKGRSE